MMENDPEHGFALLAPLSLIMAGAALLVASGFAALAASRRPRTADRVATGLLTAGAILGLVGIGFWFAAPDSSALASGWSIPWGKFSVAIDGLSAAFLLPVLVIPALASVYGLGYWPQSRHGASATRLRIFLGLLAASMVVLVLARDGVLMLIAYEVMTLSVFFLITTEDERAEVRHAGWIYLTTSHIGFMCILAAFVIFFRATGSFELTPANAAGMDLGSRTAVFLLVLLGFGVKAGIMPMHVWLPGAHANAPSHVSAVFSGVVIKTGIYVLARFTAILPDPPMVWGLLLLLLGGVSGVLGVACAIGQHDLKRLLAYHSIENIGIIVMGLAVAVLGRWDHRPDLVVLGMSCAIMHTWNHGLFKSLLFLSAGSVIHAAQTRQIERMGGLWRSMPWSAGLFTLGAVAICGLPPLNGFVSEFFLYIGALHTLGGDRTFVASIAAPTLALIGALACACFIKVVGCVFLGNPRSDGLGHVHECQWVMRVPMLVLAALCVLLGLAPYVAVGILDQAVSAWSAGDTTLAVPSLATLIPFGAIARVLVAALIVASAMYGILRILARAPDTRRAVTWDCGYAAPSRRMQYTASSFVKTLAGLFAFVLRPREHHPDLRRRFPLRSHYEGHVEDITLARIVMPLCRWVADHCVSLRQRQSGRIQAYIASVIFVTAGLLLFVVPIAQLLRRLVSE